MRNKLFLTKEWLYEQYWNKQFSASQLGRDLNCTKNEIIYLLKKYNIPRRSRKEATRLAISGDKNPAKRPEVKIKLSGENNHFHGKHHTKETKEKLSSINKTEKNIERLNRARNSEKWQKAMFDNNVMFNSDIKIKHKIKINEAKEKFSGENNPRWKGGITLLNDQIRHSKNMKEWRFSIYKRDNFQCVLCSMNKRLNADHIKAFSTIIYENNIKTFDDAIKCKELWDLNNGRTLCVNCHKQTENYGAKAWKKQQKEDLLYRAEEVMGHIKLVS